MEEEEKEIEKEERRNLKSTLGIVVARALLFLI